MRTQNKSSLIFIASSWKQRERVRNLANEIRKLEFDVYDFTDPSCRKTPEVAPEKYPELFDPQKHIYWNYLHKQEWFDAIEENRRNIDNCDKLVLLLPCGIDATADWAYAFAKEKETYIVGEPPTGERSPVHLWANGWFPDEHSFLHHLTDWVSTASPDSFPFYLEGMKMLNILRHESPLKGEELINKTIQTISKEKQKFAKEILKILIERGKIIVTLGL